MSDKSKTFRLPVALYILLGIVVVLELAAPFFARTNGVDGPSQLNLETQFNSLLSQGIVFPKWVPQGFHGFGSPAFYFYPPLAFYATGILQLLSGVSKPDILFQAVGLLATLASFFAARKLLLAIGSVRNQALLGAALYAFAPFRIAELYSRSSLSSHVAYIFLPLVWCGLVQIFGNWQSGGKTWKGTLLFSVSFALLMLTSIPLAVVTIVTMLVAAAVFRRELRAGAVWRLALGTVLTIGLVAFYVIPVVLYEPYVKLQYLSKLREFFIDDLFHLRNFAGLYHLALLYGGMAAFLFAYWRVRRHRVPIAQAEKNIFQFTLAVLAFIVVLEVPPIGRPLLTKMPLLELVQGTWRFYIDVVLLGACVVGIARTAAMQKAARQIIWIWSAGALLPAVLIVLNLHLGTHQVGPAVDPPEYHPIYVHAGDSVLEGAKDGIEFATGRGYIRPITEKPDREDDSVSSSSAGLVTFHRFYWPAWHLYANGRELKTSPDSILGLARAELPAGDYEMTWKLERTPLETAGLLISGMAWGGVLLTVGIGLAQRRVTLKGSSSP